jgi:hypothetical protein
VLWNDGDGLAYLKLEKQSSTDGLNDELALVCANLEHGLVWRARNRDVERCCPVLALQL